MDRKPPAAIRRALRKEVGFGCPVGGCNSPYLSYHHFDPPWEEQEHHNIDGMIALCLPHHKEADVGAFTQSQLRQFKLLDQRQLNQRIRGRFNWKREDLLIVAGSNFFIGSPTILETSTRKLIWFAQNEDGFSTINMDLYSSRGQLVFSMRDNDWITIPTLDDLICPPSARSLKVRSRSHNVSLDLEFTNRSYEDLDKYLVGLFRPVKEMLINNPLPDPLRETFPELPPRNPDDEIRGWINVAKEYAQQKLSGESITVCVVNVRITYPVPLLLSPTRLEINGQMRFTGSYLGDSTVLRIQ